MIDRSEAEEHLRVIRSLMERATVYRAISAEAAAVGGVLALAASFGSGNWLQANGWPAFMRTNAPSLGFSVTFLSLWTVVLIVTGGANLWFLWRDAKRRNEAFVSSGMRLALRALAPSYIVAFFFTLKLGAGPHFPSVVPIWIICHGVGLLGTAFFAPRSLHYLGWAFLLIGLVSAWSMSQNAFGPGLLLAQQWMALSFGLLHIVYAACTWPRRAR